MTDENLEENEDARNNNSTADHVTKYNQINKVFETIKTYTLKISYDRIMNNIF